MTVAITVEGVLRKVVGGAPIKDGIDLYYSLATRFKMVLLTEDFENGGDLNFWLMTEGMREHQRIIWNSPMYGQEPVNAPVRRICQIHEARHMGHDVTLIVEPNPSVSAEIIRNGYNVLTFSHAEYSVPIWRPDYRHKPTPWDELTARVDREAALRAADARRDEQE